MQISVKRLSETAKIPTKAYENDAGWDLYADENLTIFPSKESTCLKKGVNCVNTGIAMAIPVGYFGMIKPKSGLSVKHGLDVLAGIVDASFRGHLKVVLDFPSSEWPPEIKKGEKIAQILILPVPETTMVEVDSLDETDRGEKGFGSSGK